MMAMMRPPTSREYRTGVTESLHQQPRACHRSAQEQDRTQVVTSYSCKSLQFGSLLTSAQSFGGSSYPGSKYDLSCAVFTRRAIRSTVAATPFCSIKWCNPCTIAEGLPGPNFPGSASSPTKAASPCWL